MNSEIYQVFEWVDGSYIKIEEFDDEVKALWFVGHLPYHRKYRITKIWTGLPGDAMQKWSDVQEDRDSAAEWQKMLYGPKKTDGNN